MKRYDAVIFDLDGTLLDTLEDLTLSTNHALERCGFPARTKDEVRRFVGSGARMLALRAVPQGTAEEDADRVLAAFREHYSAHAKDHTAPYEGVMAMLEALGRAGVKQAVLSNKPDAQVKALCSEHFAQWITLAAGDREGVPRKPAPDAVKRMMEELDALPERTLYVGDSDVDVMTACNAGIDCAAVTWGFRSAQELRFAGAEVLVDDCRALSDLVLMEEED